MVTFDSVSLGSVATYTCDPAFSLVGEPTRTCVRIGANTVWSGQAPTCQCKNACTPEKTNKQSLTCAPVELSHLLPISMHDMILYV